MKYTRNEELANAVSHLTGALLSVAALILMVSFSLKYGNAWHVVSTSVFGATMILLYLSSTLTHILPMGKVKDLFFDFDRISIYLLIAGTYTPLALLVLKGPLGWVILGIEWGLALAGTLMTLLKPGDYRKRVHTFYVLSYALMGWMVLIVIVPLFRELPLMGSLWILIGGVCYTIGIPIYKLMTFPYHHLLWHMLVLAGTMSHFFAVFFFMIPR